MNKHVSTPACTNCCPTCGHALEPTDLVFDEGRNSITRQGETVRLTGDEFRFARILFTRAPAVVEKDSIYQAMFAHRHFDEQPEPKIIDVYVCKIRRKIAPLALLIETSWGRGYAMQVFDMKIADLVRFDGERRDPTKRWNEADDDELCRLVGAGVTGLTQLGAIMKRPYANIQRALDRLVASERIVMRNAAAA
jgi:DNA-binding winged helix-turn-helix (wHTH) protein